MGACRALHPDIVGAGAAATDASAAAVPQPTVIRCTPGDRQIEGWIGENKRLPGMGLRVVPVSHHVDKSLPHGGGLKDAAVEENRSGSRFRVTLQVPSKKSGHVPCDRRVADVRESHLVQAGARTTDRFCVTLHQRQKAVEHDLANIVGVQCCVLGAAHDLPAASHNRDGIGCGRVGTQQGLLGRPASLAEHPILSCIEAAAAGQAPLDELRQSQVHIIAAQQQMVAHGLADKT